MWPLASLVDSLIPFHSYSASVMTYGVRNRAEAAGWLSYEFNIISMQ